MNTPEWLNPGIYGAVIGAAFVGVAGFSWGGWVTGGTANDRARAMFRADVVASMAPVCLGMAQSGRLGRASWRRSGPPRSLSGATVS